MERTLVAFLIALGAVVASPALSQEAGEPALSPVAAEPALSPVAAEPALSPVAAEPEFEVSTAEGAAPVEGYIENSTFTTAVVDRVPEDTINTLGNDQDQIFYFTDVRDMTGQTLTHRWEFNGQVMAEVHFEIGGPRWRIYSSKTLEPSWLGDWTATAIDSSGLMLSSNTFSYTLPKPPPQAIAPEGTVPSPASPAMPE